MGRGQKTCPDCGNTTGPRTYQCSNCQHKFTFKPAGLRTQIGKDIKDWRELENGEIIRVVQGTGPVWRSHDEELEEQSMGYAGLFRVVQVIDDGILAHSLKSSDAGRVMIYMGEEERSKVDPRLLKRPHKLRKATKKELLVHA